jgi:predicted ATPase
MVDHLTRIDIDAGGARAAELVQALSRAGFRVVPQGGRLVAESSAVEAGEAQRQLRALGFADREYRVSVEFVRQWGYL